jgi:PAS domain S-box-containing protein
MAGRIRRFAWETTSAGAISGWSETLLCAVNLILESQFPTMLIWGPEMVVLYNDACLPLLAEKHPRALGQTAHECWSEAWHILAPKLTPVLERGAKLYFENELIPIVRQGSLADVYWTYSYSPVRDPAGVVCGILVVSHDVTAKLTAEHERDSIAANLRNVLESTTDGLVVLDIEGRYTYVNEQAARIVGLRPVDMIGKSQWDLFPHASETEFGRQYRQAVNTGKPRHFDNFYPEPLNTWFECHCYPSEHGVSIYFRDVTEQKQTEKALRDSESRFRKLFESDLMGVAIPDRFGAFRESNDHLLKMTGFTREDQAAGRVRWDTMTPPEYADLDAARIREAAERGSCTPYEKEYIRKDGTRVPILCGYALLEGSEDEYIGFVLDLSELKRAELELREREERFRVLAESVPQLIWITNPAGENIYCNRRFHDYTGLPEPEMMGLHWKNLIHPDDLSHTLNLWNACLETGEPYLNEYRLRRKDGAYRHFLARAVPLQNALGEIERWIGSSTDIHDQKLAEDALRKSEKLATAGRLAASVAHEINNPLAAVTNSLYLALLDESLSATTKAYLQTAEQELRRVAHITTQTLRFHKQSNSPVRIDVCDIVDSVLALFGQRLANKNIEVKAECDQGSYATCLADEVRQVIANLVSNALDATPEMGTLRLRVARTKSWTPEPRNGVKIVVADTGHGIPPAILDRIFEPFISTKDATGIGLGLWVSEGIVRKHGGTIRVRSKANVHPSGTVFTVFLPSHSMKG